MELKGRLHAFHSLKDRAGNLYWAFRFTEYATGKRVEGFIGACTGDSNLYGVLFGWSVPNKWDRSIEWQVTPMPIREFDRMKKGWPYAGSQPEEIAKWIKARLTEQT